MQTPPGNRPLACLAYYTVFGMVLEVLQAGFLTLHRLGVRYVQIDFSVNLWLFGLSVARGWRESRALLDSVGTITTLVPFSLLFSWLFWYCLGALCLCFLIVNLAHWKKNWDGVGSAWLATKSAPWLRFSPEWNLPVTPACSKTQS